MKNVLIAGATGMVGSLVLKHCLDAEAVGRVVSIVRRPSGMEHQKLTEILHDDFSDFSELETHFQRVHVAHFCIGAYTGQVAADVFRAITIDFPVAFANTLKECSPDSTLCFLSGQGADQTESSRVTFARFKGVAENRLVKLALGQLYIFRPGYIYPSVPRQAPNTAYRLMKYLYPVMRRVYPNGTVTSDDLAKAMVKLGFDGHANTVLENRDIRNLGKS